jgi:hypothetical protein
VCWTDGGTAQHTIPVTIKDKPYVIFVDEGSGGTPSLPGMARFIDISDEKNPVVISKLRLEIDMPEAQAQREADGGDGGFTYQGHYCGVDRFKDPTVLGCSYFWSGIRVFDIRDPYHPVEIAYYNPGGNPDAGATSQSGPTTRGYASAQVRFIAETGEMWFTDQQHGLIITKFTNGAWPFED